MVEVTNKIKNFNDPKTQLLVISPSYELFIFDKSSDMELILCLHY